MKVKEISVSVKYGNSVNYETVQVSQGLTLELDEKDDPRKKREEARNILLKECKEFIENSRKTK